MNDTCQSCGKEFTDTNEQATSGEMGQLTIGVTSGVSVPGDGFYMADDPWDLYCEDCHAKSERMIDTHPELLDKLKEVLVWKDEIENDEPINGADLVDWFVDFYKHSEAAIIKAEGGK